MVYIEHVNLVVGDIEKALGFYRAAFPHWRVRAKGKDEWYGKPRRWLHFGDDYQYITFNDNGEGENRDLAGHRRGLAHFAFAVSPLDDLVRRLADAGFEPKHFGPDHPFRKNIYFIDRDNFEIEFVEYHSDLPEQRNAP